MKLKELVLCDMDEKYAGAFATYLMENIEGINIHVYTTLESFYADNKNFDIGIISEDFLEVEEFKSEGRIESKYILTEKNEEQKQARYIYKYQAIDKILSSIEELKKVVSNENRADTEKSGKIIGIYSPISHELQMPFALSMCESLREKGRVLFVDLEEISILQEFIGGNDENNLMDLFYEISTNREMDISSYTYQFMGVDYIPPFMRPDEISEVDAKTFMDFFERLKCMGYERIVILFGRTIPGFSSILTNIDELIILSKSGDYYSKGNRFFTKYLQDLDIETRITPVSLNMSAGNLTDGTYCVEELLQGNLGVFVKRLLSKAEAEEDMLAYA